MDAGAVDARAVDAEGTAGGVGPVEAGEDPGEDVGATETADDAEAAKADAGDVADCAKGSAGKAGAAKAAGAAENAVSVGTCSRSFAGEGEVGVGGEGDDAERVYEADMGFAGREVPAGTCL